MRKQTRPPEPDVLRDHQAKWNRQWTELRERNPAAAFSWYQVGSKTAREWILDDLRGMNQGHCSFCDAFPVESLSTEPIEHFQPKSRPEFYGLAYSWDNLFYCCDRCQNQKGEEWDDRLLKPDAVDYEFSDYFQFRDGHIVPAESADDDGQARARATIRLYGFNENDRPPVPPAGTAEVDQQFRAGSG